MLGYPDQAMQVSDEKDAHARRLGHAFNLGLALTLGAYVFDYRCEPERLLERVSEADRLAREQSIPFLYQVMVPTAKASRGCAAASCPSRSPCCAGYRELGSGSVVDSHSLHEVGSGGSPGASGRPGRCPSLDRRVPGADRTPRLAGAVHLAEVLRLKGWMLMRQGRGEEAEAQLRASIDWARQQQAKSWELRSSTTLAQLLAERGQRDAARELLAPIYNWFTEGFDTKDLMEARQLLEALR